MGLKEDLLRGIYSYGFEKPSAIQQRAIKPLIMMRDTIAQAQSGTGKTASIGGALKVIATRWTEQGRELSNPDSVGPFLVCSWTGPPNWVW